MALVTSAGRRYKRGEPLARQAQAEQRADGVYRRRHVRGRGLRWLHRGLPSRRPQLRARPRPRLDRGDRGADRHRTAAPPLGARAARSDRRRPDRLRVDDDDGAGAGDGAVLYVWPVLWTTFFFGRRAALSIVACVGVAHAVTLLLLPAASSYPGRWVDVMVSVSVVSVVTLTLVRRNDLLLDQLVDEARTDALTGLLNALRRRRVRRPAARQHQLLTPSASQSASGTRSRRRTPLGSGPCR